MYYSAMKFKTDAALSTGFAEYFSASVRGDHRAASHVVDTLLQSDVSPLEIYEKIIIPSQHKVGDEWVKGSLSVPQEHLATQIAFSELSRLRDRLPRQCSIGIRCVVTTVAGDHHGLSGRLVADYLFIGGWDVDYLGTDTPTSDLVEFVSANLIPLVVLSITNPDVLDEARSLIDRLHALKHHPKVLVGGRGLSFEGTKSRLSADSRLHDVSLVDSVAKRLVEYSETPTTLPELLKSLGRAIVHQRKALGYSQKQLADAADLERVYISAIENGKQNLSLGALLKIALALKLKPSQLLGGGEIKNP